MTKSLFATALCLSLALSGGVAAPARADDEDVARALAAIAAIAIIGAAIDNRNDGRPPAPPRLEPLPPECVFEYWGPNGPDHALSARCLGRELRHPARLPGSCRTEVRVMPWQDRSQPGHSRHGQTRDAYDIGCLYRAGYRFDH